MGEHLPESVREEIRSAFFSPDRRQKVAAGANLG